MSYQTKLRSDGVLENILLIQHTLNPAAKTAIDIGCNEALVAAHIDNLGLKTDAVEGSDEYFSLAQKFLNSNFSNVSLNKRILSIDDVKILNSYDVVIFNSVYQQIVNFKGVDYANSFLRELIAKTNLQLFFQPCVIHKKHGCEMPFVENDYASVESYFKTVTADMGVDMRFVGLSKNNIPLEEPYRPLYVFEKQKPSTSFSLPTPIECLSVNNVRLTIVDLDKCLCTRELQLFGKSGWHHKTVLAREIIKALQSNEKQFNLHETKYANYMRSFKPQRYGEVWSLSGFDEDNGVLSNMPLRNYCSWYPWSLTEDTNDDILNGKTRYNAIPNWDMSMLGPMSEDLMVNEVKRMHDLVVLFNKHGYRPELNYDGFIRGQVLTDGKDYRFIVEAGQHRLGVLSALGYQQIKVKVTKPPVNINSLDNWALVKRALFTKAQAENIFQNFMKVDGYKIANNLELL